MPPTIDLPSSARNPSRRRILFAGMAAAAGATAARAADAPAPALPETATTGTIPMTVPRTEFVYESVVDLAPTVQLGMSPFGERRMVPITGGTFEGPGLRGIVVPGGADRQLVRRDGSVALDAIYELQTDDGVVISVRNRVLSRRPKDAPAYVFSNIELTAPEGRYGWLNDFVYVGTLNSLRPQRAAVVIRAFRVL
ncbi:DUF3237 domain-containing protein [Variovorax sp. YR216]|uniref:DUF3237 domain-containing protein n=1 Tax=Variovorax sp. YR216 TaxID=1882828 RepID=UPI00089CF325|nr:DUF3237 domain-containing protein [Variovorax sp. YR216]SEB24898.1 Protein of unknown function [Variovorax sp. YR216]